MDLTNLDTLPSELRTAAGVQQAIAGEMLFQQGDVATSLFAVRMGRVKLERYIDEGRIVTLYVARTRNVFGTAGLILNTYPYAAIAEIPSQVIHYPKSALISALQTSPDLAETLITMLAQVIQTLEIRLELRDIRAPHQRVLRYLRYQSQDTEESIITFDRAFKDIARELGFTAETLSRAITRLEQQGLISRHQQQIILHPSQRD
ncbi:MAG: Crp/Fnr family transcriptional regulator [Cyanobacteria bacterium P01_G01_bin.38]